MRHDTTDTDRWLDRPATRGQILSAAAVIAVVVIGFSLVAPFAGTQLAQLNVLFPTLDAIVLVTDLVTAVLLFAQYSIFRSRALFALATGYLFTALIVIPHSLTFKGAFAPTGLLGANIQTGSWLFIFWHLGFAVALLAYALLQRIESTNTDAQEASPGRAIVLSIAIVSALVCALTWLSTAGATLLPQIILENNRLGPFVVYPIWLTILVSAAAFALLALTRRHSILNLWLMVLTFAYIAELAFSGLFPSVRFSAGFYAGRVFSLMTASIVLIVLLAEITRLYVHLVRSNAMLQRERTNRLMSLEAAAGSIVHEMAQPLAATMIAGAAARQQLKRTPPDPDKVNAAMDTMISASREAIQRLEGIRALFGRQSLTKEPLDLNGLTLQALRAVEPEVRSRGIITRVELASELPPVMGHRSQLQEVIINLVQNAIEAMEPVAGQRMLKIRTGPDGHDSIVLAVEDTGPGLSSEQTKEVFNAFVTSKPHGMGLGLAICQMIVERHEGHLSVSSANPCGAIFSISLPRGASFSQEPRASVKVDGGLSRAQSTLLP